MSGSLARGSMLGSIEFRGNRGRSHDMHIHHPLLLDLSWLEHQSDCHKRQEEEEEEEEAKCVPSECMYA